MGASALRATRLDLGQAAAAFFGQSRRGRVILCPWLVGIARRYDNALRRRISPLDRAARGILGHSGTADPLAQAAAEDSRVYESTFLQVVRRRRNESVLQRDRPASDRARRTAGNHRDIHRDRRRTHADLSRIAPGSERVRGGAAPRREEGRTRRHHAEHGRGGVRRAGLRTPRCVHPVVLAASRRTPAVRIDDAAGVADLPTPACVPAR